jgi:hypothetical protein
MTPREFVFFCEGMNTIFHNHDDFDVIYEAVKKQYSHEADVKYITSKGGDAKMVTEVLRETDELKKFFGTKK